MTANKRIQKISAAMRKEILESVTDDELKKLGYMRNYDNILKGETREQRHKRAYDLILKMFSNLPEDELHFFFLELTELREGRTDFEPYFTWLGNDNEQEEKEDD